jgi:hypothetical protein
MIDLDKVTRTPLFWPPGVARSRSYKGSPFTVKPGVAIRELREEIQRHADPGEYIISSNLELRLDGEPKVGQQVHDPGAAVYLLRNARPFVLACDHYGTVYANFRALTKTLEALRTIARHGASDLLERAYSGFLALSAPIVVERPWWEVLGVRPESSLAEAKRAFRQLALERVPELERSGDIFAPSGHDELVELNGALARAKEARPSCAG